MIDGKTFFDQPTNNKFKTCENIIKIETGKWDDCTTGFLLYYPYFNKNYKMIAIDLSKYQALHFDLRAIQQINFTANLDRAGNTAMLFYYRRIKRNCLGLFTRTVKVL